MSNPLLSPPFDLPLRVENDEYGLKTMIRSSTGESFAQPFGERQTQMVKRAAFLANAANMAAAWFDMSTAPRDGSRILVSRRQRTTKPLEKRVVIARFNHAPGRKCWTAELCTYHTDQDFEGWMPLPLSIEEMRS